MATRSEKLLWVVRVLLVVGIAVVLAQNYREKRLDEAQQLRLEARLKESIKPGDSLRLLGGVGLDGRRVEADVTSKQAPTLIFTFSSECPACLDSLPGWRRLADVAAKKNIQTVCVSKTWLPTLAAFVESGETVPGLMVAEPNYPTYTRLHLDMVPFTLVVGTDGLVKGVWPGKVTEQMEGRIAEQLTAISSLTQEGKS